MLGAYFSPLAPVAILLLSAFILPIVMPRLPSRWDAYPKIREFGASGLVGVALLSLLGLRLTYGPDSSGKGLELISGWNFTADGSGAALTVRADGLSLAFLLAALFVLLAVTFLHSKHYITENEMVNWSQVSGWLVIGTSACLLFISANGLTLIYTVMIFDIIAAVHWLGQGHRNLGVARLFLGIFTAAGLVLDTLAASIGPVPGIFLLGAALWLRLGLFPYLEIIAHRDEYKDKHLVYLGLSLAVGIYLTLRVVGQPLPAIISWLAVVTMLLSGLMAWLVGASIHSEVDAKDRRTQMLVWLILTQSLLILLARPLEIGSGMAFGMGLILSLVALWVTPALGRPRFSEGAWSWPYLPAVFASYTLIGLPLSLGWPARVAVYQSLFRIDNLVIVLIVILAEAFSLSGLVRYWFTLVGQGNEASNRRSVVGIVMMVPFLVPALAPFVLSTITRTELSSTSAEQFSSIWIVIVILVAGAIGLDYFRGQIIDRLALPVPATTELLSLHWFFRWWEALLDRAGKAVLRVRVTLEGQHYIGWAILVALIGGLIILLR